MLRKWTLAGAVALTWGCGGQPSPKAGTQAPAVLTPSVAGLTASVNGEPLSLVAAAAYSPGSSAIEVLLSTAPLPCEAFTPTGRDLAEGEQTVSLEFQPRVQADGALKWVATRLETAQRSVSDRKALAGGVTLEQTDVGQPLTLKADLQVTEAANDFLDWPEARIRLQGAAVAAGCGVRPSSVNQDLQRTPQGNLKITYGGRPVAIQGASFDGTRLRLSAGGIHCELEGRTDLFMDARLGDKFEPQVKVRVKGDLVDGDSSLVVAPQPPEGAPQSDWLTVTPGAEPTDAKAPWPLQVQGRFSVDGLPVVVDGQVQALRCR